MPNLDVTTVQVHPLLDRFQHTLNIGIRFDADQLTQQTEAPLLSVDGVSHRQMGDNLTYRLDARRMDGVLAMQLLSYRDKGQPVRSEWKQMTPGYHHAVLVGKRSTAPRAYDGETTLFLDGQPFLQQDGLDLYWRHYPDFITVSDAVKYIGQEHLDPYYGPVVLRRR